MLNDNDVEILGKLFYGETDPNFIMQNFNNFIKIVRHFGYKYKYSDLLNFYNNQEIIQITAPRPKIKAGKEKDKKVFHIVNFDPFSKFYMDTMFIPKYGIALICGLDLFSRYGFAKLFKIKREDIKGITSQKSVDSLKDFMKIIDDLGYNIINICVDEGSEFKNDFKKFVEQHNINLITSNPQNPLKNRNIERFNKTLRGYIEKYHNTFSGNITQQTINKLIEAYNNSFHTSLNGNTPYQALTSPTIFNELYEINTDIKEEDLEHKKPLPKLKKGQWVRYFYRDKDNFAKYGKNFTKTLYKIKDYNNQKQGYELEDVPNKYFRREYLYVVNKELFDKYNYKETKMTPFIINNEEKPLNNKRISRSDKEIINQPIIHTSRKRNIKQVERLNL